MKNPSLSLLLILCAHPLWAQNAKTSDVQVETLLPPADAPIEQGSEARTAVTGEEPVTLHKVVVTAGPETKPLEVALDTKAPAQPIPAQDGADYLKAIPGFSVIRKGGIDGDPVLRGQAGSRLNILLDGQNIFGGCGNRMDPPTAYVFPSAYTRVVVVKGPQSVLHGPGASAGVVLFEREATPYCCPAAAFEAAGTVGSFGRRDASAEVSAGAPLFNGRLAGSVSRADDYQDGAGRTVHSNYRRWSTNAALSLTPSEKTTLELSLARSDGQAAYADRTMDGTQFLRDNVGFRFVGNELGDWVRKVELSCYYNYADHVMDNYSLRAEPMMRMLSNPDRHTVGGRALVVLQQQTALALTLGADYQRNTHSLRTSLEAPRVRDAAFMNLGVFGELTYPLSDAGKLVFGLRRDGWSGKDQRTAVRLGTGMMTSYAPNPTAGQKRDEALTSGFARAEYSFLKKRLTAYAGLGVASRFPDYWELLNKETQSSLSSFTIKPEQTAQLDTGLLYHKGAFQASLALFGNRSLNYILVESNYLKPASMSGQRSTTIVRNVDARSYGGEFALAYTFREQWRFDASVAAVRGENLSDHKALAQQPPVEGRLGVSYVRNKWFVGAGARFVARQNRYALNQGNIVGQDLGPSAGFSLFSLNAGLRLGKAVQASVGVDNLFDKTYAEFISRGGSAVAGFETTTRVNEPGRTVWMKVDFKF